MTDWRNTIHIVALFWCFSFVMNDGRTRSDCMFMMKRNRWKWEEYEKIFQNNTEDKHSSVFLSIEIECVSILLLLSLLVVLMIWFEWFWRKRRNKNMWVTIDQVWWKHALSVIQLPVLECVFLEWWKWYVEIMRKGK